MSAVATERCPWCGNPISRERFLQIQAAIRDEERRKLVAAERELKVRIEKEVALQQKKLDRERQAIAADRAKLTKQIEAAKQQAEKQRLKEIAEVRQILQKDREAALLKRDAEFARERDALQRKISDMTRRIQKKGGELAEGSELDLYEELRGAFPEDHITRVAKWKGGRLIVHDVRYKDKSAGKIAIDATQRAAWQHAFIVKLRQAQTELGADYAILSTAVFPAGRKELLVDSGVIAVAPARVPAVVEVLRRALVAVHVAKLSGAERTDKLSQLFKFITSPAFKRKLGEAENLAEEALQLEVQEKKAHDNIWRKRGEVLSRIKRVLREIDHDVSAIIESRGGDTPANGGSVVPIRPRMQ